MEKMPFNKILHKNLIKQGYSYIQHVRYDRYDLNGRTIFFYMNGYVMIIERNGEPATREVYNKIRSDANAK